jgi:hypothetical protein
MSQKPSINLKQYLSPKKGKGFIIKIVLYTVLLIAIYFFIQMKLKQPELKTNPKGIKEIKGVTIDTTNLN